MAASKHLTFVINDFTVGGAQRLFIQLANRFADDGYEVEFISLVILKDRADMVSDVSPKIKVTRLEFSSTSDFKSWRKLSKLLQQHQSPIFSTLSLANLTTRALKIFHGREVIVVEQNTYDNKSKLFILLDRILSWVTKIIICTSESVYTFTQKQTKIAPSKFKVIHSGVDVEKLKANIIPSDKAVLRQELGIADVDVVFLNVARLAEQKSQDKLIQGFDLFLKQRNDKEKYKLVIVGEGKEREALEKLIVSLGLQKQVQLVGVRKDVARFYNMADFFVSSSRIEGFSIVHAEAMAFGLPILTTKTAGPDVMIVDGQNGFFVDFTAEAMGAGLGKIVAADYQALSQEAFRRIKDFTLDATYEQYKKLI